MRVSIVAIGVKRIDSLAFSNGDVTLMFGNGDGVSLVVVVCFVVSVLFRCWRWVWLAVGSQPSPSCHPPSLRRNAGPTPDSNSSPKNFQLTG